MFGDFEAQRHWMEITCNLPAKEWYRNSSKNDLMYWGLDYPPLTAYHMYFNGKILGLTMKDDSSLNTRGHESPELKTFMRTTVVVADMVFFLSAMLVLEESLVITALFPGLILIDHGHFQYNCVSLGLTLWAVCLLCKRRTVLGSIAFSLAINYKHMSMYHSLPFFFYILGSNTMKVVVSVAVAVIASFFLSWVPLLEVFGDVLSRLFPVSRGLFEDKVANVWCALEVVVKLRKMFTPETLFKTSACVTLLATIPSSLHLLMKPSFKNFVYSLVISSLAFFLFSFQVSL